MPGETIGALWAGTSFDAAGVQEFSELRKERTIPMQALPKMRLWTQRSVDVDVGHGLIVGSFHEAGVSVTLKAHQTNPELTMRSEAGAFR
jgi:hypothetical protein